MDPGEPRPSPGSLEAPTGWSAYAFDALDAGIAVQDSASAIRWINPAASSILGLSLDEVLGRTSMDPRWQVTRVDGTSFLGEEHPSMVAISSGVRQQGVVMGLILPNGEQRWITINSVPFMVGDERWAVSTFADITESRQVAAELAERERMYRLLAENSADVIVHADHRGVLQYISPSVERVLGYEPSSLLGTRMLSLVHPDEQAHIGRMANAVRTGEQNEARLECRIQTATRGWMWIEATLHGITAADGEPNDVVSTMRDISDRKRQEAAAAEVHELFRAAFDDAPLGMALSAVGEVMSGRFVRLNRVYASILGYEVDDLLGRSFYELIHPDDLPGVFAGREALVSGEVGRDQRDVRMLTASGEWLWVDKTRSVVLGADGEPLYVMGQIADATERRASYERTMTQALTDSLTGLRNRRALELALASDMGEPGHQVGVVFCDVDGLKAANDNFGHPAGDQLLRQVSDALRTVTRSRDIVSRFGGDEFVVIVRGEDAHAATPRVVERLGRLRFEVDGHSSGLSVGAALGRSGDDPAGLIEQADQAMYRAKHRRRIKR